MKLRKFLSFILKGLSRWAIDKHKLRIAVVVGTSGIKITAEMFGEMLSKDHVVRKQLEKPFWDFSIPLSILGIEDRRYTFLGWVDVLFESFKVLLFGKSNPGWVILQVSSLKNYLIDYWIEIVTPDITIVSNYNGKLLPSEKKIMKASKKVVLCCGVGAEKPSLKVLTIGEFSWCDMKVGNFTQDKHGTRFTIKYKNKKCRFVAAQTGIFMKFPILASVGGLLAMGKDLEDVSERLMKVEIMIERFIHE